MGRRAFAFVVGLLGALGIAPGPTVAAPARPAAVNGTAAHYAVISPTFLGTGGVGPESFIRLVNATGTGGSTAASNFSVTLVGIPSGKTYGQTLTVPVPRMASIQLSIAELYNLTGGGLPNSGDTGFAVYLQNSDSEAGYQHVVYDFTSSLFENMSACNSTLGEETIALHKEIVLTNLHTSKLNGSSQFPSTIKIHNYNSASMTYTMTVYNAGGRTSGAGLVLQSDSGKLTCTIPNNVIPANSTLAIPFSTIEATSGCALDSDEAYANLVVAESSGTLPPDAIVTHTIAAGTFQGNNLNMTPVCAVNPAVEVASPVFDGTIASSDGTTGTFSVTLPANVVAIASALKTNAVETQQSTAQVSGSVLASAGNQVALTGTYDPTTNELTASGGGYVFSGSVNGDFFTGTYTGPNNTSGGFSSINGATDKVTAYCGTTKATTGLGSVTGVFNVQISASGVISGTATNLGSTQQPIIGISGQVNGTSLYGFAFNNYAPNGNTFGGTIQNGTISGTITFGVGGSGGSGTFSGSVCALPS